jgi:hypothetical protein
MALFAARCLEKDRVPERYDSTTYWALQRMGLPQSHFTPVVDRKATLSSPDAGGGGSSFGFQ